MFIELHAQSAFSFLEGAELPEAYAAAAARLGMPAVALCDRDGVYGAPRFTRAALDAGVKPIIGSEITLTDGSRLPLLVEDREGYQTLCHLITRMKLGAAKGSAGVTLAELAPYAAGLVCLTGGAYGPLALRLDAGDVAGARGALERLVTIFGRSSCYVEVQRHLEREQERVVQGLVALARAAHIPLVATSQPLHARPEGRLLADVFTCIREKTDLDHAGRLLAVNGERRLRSDREMTRLFHDLPDALTNTGELALRLGFTLKDLGYRFPDFPLPPGQTPLAHLRELVARGVRARYGTGPLATRARRQVAHEIDVIGRLDLAGYFLIVWDIVEYCRANDILVQGRGSAANSAVCYALGITAVDPIGMELLFERVLSEARGEWPDIDIDLPSGERREAGIQYVYRPYGHLGQHSGGMVIAAGRLDNVVPLEPATMPGRVVIQWDKDDCAGLGIIKIDLLGLGMMAVLQDSLTLVGETGGSVDLARLPPDDPAVYRSLQQADTIGVFQVESRAQMATLPRIHPERFYDLVVQVAIIRPGPIVGQMVHPYVRRRRGREPVTYPHPSLEPILKRTLGVPLFQEQLLRMAMVAAGFTATEAEELRRAVGFKRSERLMADVETKLRAGMARQGIHGAAAEEIVHAITSFALYGFPESHASSFALLAYASAYLKVHHPAAFYAALLNNQPMGFYHPATIIKDAQRHGLRILPIDIARSQWLCTVQPGEGRGPSPGCISHAVRLGLRYVRGLREAAARAIVRAREERPFASVHDLARRVGLERDELTTLAAVGALASLGATRRASLWEAALLDPGRLFEPPRGSGSPLAEMTEGERLVADYAGTGVTLGRHPMAMRRAELRRRGVLSARELASAENETRVRVAGSVNVRQRPGTAKGFVLLSLEDETGIANVIVTPQRFARHRMALVTEPFLLVEGIVQQQDGVVSVRATRVEGLSPLAHNVPSHDFG